MTETRDRHEVRTRSPHGTVFARGPMARMLTRAFVRTTELIDEGIRKFPQSRWTTEWGGWRHPFSVVLVEWGSTDGGSIWCAVREVRYLAPLLWWRMWRVKRQWKLDAPTARVIDR